MSFWDIGCPLLRLYALISEYELTTSGSPALTIVISFRICWRRSNFLVPQPHQRASAPISPCVTDDMSGFSSRRRNRNCCRIWRPVGLSLATCTITEVSSTIRPRGSRVTKASPAPRRSLRLSRRPATDQLSPLSPSKASDAHGARYAVRLRICSFESVAQAGTTMRSFR